MRAALLFFAALLPVLTTAQTVSLAGQMGSRALLVIDGQTQTLGVGESARGVKLVRIDGDSVVVERGGQQNTLRAGGAPARLTGTTAIASGPRTITIPVGMGGHFVAQGAINGRAVQFMVDTGATMVAMSRGEAERIGVDWKGGQATVVGTANGAVEAHRVTLSSVRVGDVEIANVAAVISPAPMSMILLGNSFLSRFQMQRDSDTLRLVAR